MKWILHRIGRLIAVPSQQASGQEPHTPADPQQAESVPNSQPHAEMTFDAKRKVLGVCNIVLKVAGRFCTW